MHAYPYWWDTAPSFRTHLPCPELRQEYDVAIIGAGYTGLAAARHLARAGASVAVFDGEGIGGGASSRNGGQVLTGLRPDATTLVSRYGAGRARQLFDISIESIARLEALVTDERIACELTRSGHVQAAWKPAHFEAFREEQAVLARVFDHSVTLVPAANQRSELGSDRYYGLLLDPRSAVINPAQYVVGLAHAAARAGATIAAPRRVMQIARSGARWTVGHDAGRVDAGNVLMATNGYTTSIAPELERRLIPVGSYIIATEPLGEGVCARLLPRRRAAFDSKHFLFYFRLTADGRLLFGGRAEFSAPTRDSIDRAAQILRTGMITIFPDLHDVRIDYAWGGSVAFTRDELPHAGQLGGLYYAGGYGGHGIALATYLGEVVARRIGGEAVTNPLLDEKFGAIPLYHGKPWFLPLVGAYYKVLDWIW
jgi:glycine/D-amino acid oxidase-like deaminating enzyme